MIRKGWFRIKRTSSTGKALEKILKRKLAFGDKYTKFKEKYNIQSAHMSSYYLANIKDVSFNEGADTSQWIRVSKHSKYYIPIKGTQAYKDFVKLNKNAVKRWEIDMALGSTSEFPEAGFDARFKDYIFVYFGQGCTYILSDDCVPISDKEYRLAERSGMFNS